MGQLRQAHCPVGTKPTQLPTLRSRMLAPLVAGFTLSSVAVFAAAGLGGAALRSLVSMPTDVLLASALVACAGVDVLYPRIRPTLFDRQTPRTLSGRFSIPVTGFLWGLDTGSVVSTIRASAASWAALALTFAGWGRWWTGFAYAAAFCIPLTLLVATYPLAGGRAGERSWRRRSTESLVVGLSRTVRYVRYAAASLAIAGVAVAVQGGW